MRKLALLLFLFTLPAWAQQSTGNALYNFTFTQQLVWGPTTIGTKTICTPSTASVCNLPATANVAGSATLSVIGGTAPYTWTGATLPKGVTLGTSTGLTNTLTWVASATDPCPATGTCFTVAVTDSSVTSQTLKISIGKGDTEVAVIVPAKAVNVNGQVIATK